MQEFCPPRSPYTKEFLLQIYKDFVIPEDKELRVKRFLDSGSDSWHWQTHLENGIGQTKDVSRLLGRLKSNAEKLKESLDQISPELWEVLCTDIYTPGQNPYGPHVKYKPYDGHSLSVTMEYPTRRSLDVSLDELTHILDGLGEVAQEMDSALPPRKQGPKTDRRLTTWIRSAGILWTRELGREFTRDFEKNEPVSPAARFCVRAYYILDPDTPPSRIENAMRKFISEMEEWKQEEKRKSSE